jgi:hypothetical protein
MQRLQVMPDDHSDLVPPLPIPNRTVKRICADDSAATSVKVGHRQAFIKKPSKLYRLEGFCFARKIPHFPSFPQNPVFQQQNHCVFNQLSCMIH